VVNSHRKRGLGAGDAELEIASIALVDMPEVILRINIIEGRK